MRAHISHLDRAIVRILDERARLVTRMLRDGASDAGVAPLLSDLLRRGDGDFRADDLAAVFDLVARGCRESAGEVEA